MKGIRFGSAIGLAALVCLIGADARADDDYLKQLQTDDLRLVYYDPIQTYLTPYIGKAYENSFAYQRKMFDWRAWDKPVILLEDLSDNGGAAMRSTPFNGVTLDVAPINTTFETWTPGERFFTVMNHELVHVATMDVWNDDDAFWRNFFHAKVAPDNAHPETILYNYLSQPRSWVPRWYLEGSAVFMETWMGGGYGRAQGGYDEMVWRAMVRDDARFFDAVGLESEGNAVDFQVGANSYLYGTRFDSYLALKYGPEKLIEWLKRGNDSEGYYTAQFEKVYDKPLPDVWNDWIAWEHAWQKKNLAAIEKYPVTKGVRVTPQALGSVSRAFYDEKGQRLIAGFRNIGQLANIGTISLKDGSVHALTRLKGPMLYRATSLAFDPDSRLAFFTTDNNALRDLMQVNVDTGETKMLLEDARIGDIAFDPVDKAIWGVRRLNGLDTLMRIRATHDVANQVITLDYGTMWTDLDVSSDGSMLLATICGIEGKCHIGVFKIGDLLAGAAKPIATLDLPGSIPESGVFSDDGKYVYATSYYTGISNVYRLNIATGKWDALTNAVTGFFHPLPMADGSMIVFEYTGLGLQPMRIDPKPLDDLSSVKFLGTEIADEHPIVKTWTVGSPNKIDFDAMVKSKASYHAEDELVFDGSYPYVGGYKGHIAGGWHVQWEDPLEYDMLSANISYSPASDLPNGQQLHGDITWQTLSWKLTYWHNKADFYDLFGPTERARKGDALLMDYHDIPLYDPPRRLDFTADLNFYSGLDTLPGAQNISGAHDRNIAEGKVGWNYQDADKSLGAVDFEQGYTAGVYAWEQYSDNHAFTKIHADASVGWELPWKHASVWFYGAAGMAGGPSNNALDYYYFGAFGNNYVDDREVKRYRDYDSFPGFGIDDVSARSFAKLTGEFNLPPIRFDDVGTESFYLSSIRSAVFGGVLNASPGNEGHQTLEDVGFQLDWNFTVAVRLPMTLSMGDAVGFDGGRSHQNEVMVSLKIL